MSSLCQQILYDKKKKSTSSGYFPDKDELILQHTWKGTGTRVSGNLDGDKSKDFTIPLIVNCKATAIKSV